MQGRERKAAVAAYKERKVSAGIYAVACTASGERWVGRAPDLATIQNRLWFTLKLGVNPHPGLQQAWNSHGADRFTFEVLERLPEEALAFARDAALKRRLAHWCAALGAAVI
ncbi:hypothetical protein GCM10011611_37810 [Aliidongia dinghuensis]|uniref:GIY-YIG nuclease family protein n=1 Tax=Aliidongia dinghuensis TaxID=1867774 RepID=A0A8J3E6A2_9PROT|nr:GIY-YIG nuclease family protein [Aliidongia dinghuensis]GGF28218.1 hypothetical protein GCM10011611_37810 [Aliidongia dinghuensis]